MAIRQAKCQACNNATGEEYDDANECEVQALCLSCRAVAAGNQGNVRDPIRDPGLIRMRPGQATNVAVYHASEYDDDIEQYTCSNCGGVDWELAMVYREHATTTCQSDEEGGDMLYFGEPEPGGYGEWEEEGYPVCADCGTRHRGDYDVSY